MKPTLGPSAYLPLEKGSFWSYVAPEVRDASWVSLRVLAKERRETTDCYRVETSVDSIAGPRATVDSICLTITNETVAIVQDKQMVYEPPLPILKSPLRIGQQWAWQGKEKWTSAPAQTKETPARYELKIDKDEQVHVPAGRFRALKLRIRRMPAAGEPTSSEGHAPSVHYWFARDVGIVKGTGLGQLFGIHGELKELASKKGR